MTISEAVKCSYVQVLNGEHNVSLFTWFMNMQGTHSAKEVTIFTFESTVLILIFILIIVNSILLVVLLLEKELRNNPTNYYIMSINVVFFAFASISPLVAKSRRSETWEMGEAFCKVTVYLLAIAGTVSLWILALISVDRHFTMQTLETLWVWDDSIHLIYLYRYQHVSDFANQHHTSKSKVKTVIKIILIFVGSSLFYIPMLLHFNVYSGVYTDCEHVLQHNYTEISVCSIMWPTHISSVIWFSVLIVFVYITPLVISCFEYIKIYHTVKVVKKRIQHQRTRNGTHTGSVRCKKLSKTEIAVIKMTVVMVVLFLAMWTPIFIVLAIIETIDNVISSTALFWVFVSTVANTVVIPLVFCTMNRKVKAAIKSNAKLAFERCTRACGRSKVAPMNLEIKKCAKSVKKDIKQDKNNITVIITPP
ncbi:LOW QUALITY PROTEIN: free fatty acid receptor 4-like [Ciona intestinalis]